MTYCANCHSVEQGFEYAHDDEAEEIPICTVCGIEDSKVSVDEDYGQDR